MRLPIPLLVVLTTFALGACSAPPYPYADSDAGVEPGVDAGEVPPFDAAAPPIDSGTADADAARPLEAGADGGAGVDAASDGAATCAAGSVRDCPGGGVNVCNGGAWGAACVAAPEGCDINADRDQDGVVGNGAACRVDVGGWPMSTLANTPVTRCVYNGSTTVWALGAEVCPPGYDRDAASTFSLACGASPRGWVAAVGSFRGGSDGLGGGAHAYFTVCGANGACPYGNQPTVPVTTAAGVPCFTLPKP